MSTTIGVINVIGKGFDGFAVSVRVLQGNLYNAVIHFVFYVEKEVDDSIVEISLQYSDAYSETVKAFANNVYNPDGGTHLTGFRTSLTRVINEYARKSGMIK